jgi:hypothetical protein
MGFGLLCSLEGGREQRYINGLHTNITRVKISIASFNTFKPAYLSPASKTSTDTFASSLKRLATTSPAVPPIRDMSESLLQTVKTILTPNDNIVKVQRLQFIDVIMDRHCKRELWLKMMLEDGYRVMLENDHIYTYVAQAFSEPNSTINESSGYPATIVL